jgi:ABC-2 type transport system permease protein
VLLTGGMLTIWAVWFPIQMGGREFVSDPVVMMILALTMPMVVTGILVPDAIAGERERNTLDTLLASRLPDRSILYGKLGFGVAVGWLGTPFMMTVSVVVANLVDSLRAPTVQEAQQLTVMGIMVPFMVVGSGALLAFSNRELRDPLVAFLESAEVWLVVAAILLALLSVDALLLVAADRRFRRGRLIGRAG